jgi:hypothetical protein
MIESGFQITTTPIERILKSISLAGTGLTPSADIFVGVASSYSALGRAGTNSIRK